MLRQWFLNAVQFQQGWFIKLPKYPLDLRNYLTANTETMKIIGLKMIIPDVIFRAIEAIYLKNKSYDEFGELSQNWPTVINIHVELIII